jgi:prepilin-type N-terminal cleavage/methylation domain-containing protein
MKSIRRSREGFTLMELMVSLALLSIILAAVYSTFFLSQKAIEGLDDSLVKLQECRMTLDTMEREFESLFYNQSNKNSLVKIEDRDFFGKAAARVTFTAFSPLVPGLSVITYYVEEKDGALTVFKKLKSSLDTGKDPEGVEVIEKVEAFSVEVMNDGKWIKTWDSAETGKIPEKIRVTLTITMKDHPLTLSETATPRIGQQL